MFNDNTQKNLTDRESSAKEQEQLNDHWTCETMNNLSYTSLFGFLIRHVDVNGRCQARFPLSIILKVTRGNEVVGIQKHTLCIISYKLPWVLRQKIRPFGTLPLFFSLGRALCPPYSSAFLACKYNSFIPLDWQKAVMQESKKYHWSFKRKGVDFQIIVFFRASAPKAACS